MKNANAPGLLGLAVTLAVSSGCVSPSGAPEQPAVAETPQAPVLTQQGERYLRDVFLYTCAVEYLPYPDGEGPPVAKRTAQERAQREADLTRCLREKVEGKYTTLDTISEMTWNGKERSMTDAEMNGIVEYGPAYLDEYVEDLLAKEKAREGKPDVLATQPAPAS